MKTFRLILLPVCLLLIVLHIYELNYADLSFKTNKSQYLGMVAMFFIGASMLLSILNDKKNKK